MIDNKIENSAETRVFASRPSSPVALSPAVARVRDYWNKRIHDLEIAQHPVGTKAFFKELDDYRFEKLDYLPRVVDFSAYKGRRLLEVGCGVGTDLVRFANGGAIVTGVDLAEVSTKLARENLELNGLPGNILTMNGEDLDFEDATFDVVYAHGVLQYTNDPQRMIGEIHRALKPGGTAILMVYNRFSWLNAMSQIMHVGLEHDDAPVFRVFSRREFHDLLQLFRQFRIIPERFPVPSRLHRGWKALMYNRIFVPAFNLLPRRLIRPLGWHLMDIATK